MYRFFMYSINIDKSLFYFKFKWIFYLYEFFLFVIMVILFISVTLLIVGFVLRFIKLIMWC